MILIFNILLSNFNLGYLQLNDLPTIQSAHLQINNFLQLVLLQRIESHDGAKQIGKALSVLTLKMEQMTQMFKNGKRQMLWSNLYLRFL